MSVLLKKSTAVTFEFGPFLDDSDGNTEKTALTLVTADILLSKNHGVLAAKNSAADPTGGTNAHYRVTLDASDTGTLGKLRVYCHKTGALVVLEDFIVVTAAVYNAWIAGTDSLAVKLAAQGKVDVNAECDTALSDYAANTTTPPTAIAIRSEMDANSTKLAAQDTRLTAVRAGYLDNLNIGGPAASSAEVTAISTNTRVRVVVPQQMQLPTSGTINYVLDLYIYNTAGDMEAPDIPPTITAKNNADVDRSSKLGVVTLISTGVYKVTYTVDVADTQEQLRFEWSIVEAGNTTKHGLSGWIVDSLNVGFTSSDRSDQQAIKTKTDTLNTAAETRAEIDSNSTQLQAIIGDTIVAIDVPAVIVRPTLGFGGIRYKLYASWYDKAGNLVDPTSAVVTLIDEEGNSLSSRMTDPVTHAQSNGMTKIADGRYWIEYESTDAYNLASLQFQLVTLISGKVKIINRVVQVIEQADYVSSGAIRAELTATGTTQLVNTLMAHVVEGTLTVEQLTKLFLSALANISAGGGTDTVTFRDLANSKDRITATVDATGNRSAVVLDAT